MNATRWRGRLVVGLLAVLTPAVSARADDAARVQELYVRAYKLDKQGKSKEAIAVYEQALAAATTVLGEGHRDTTAIMGNLAELYRTSEQFEKALPLFQKALAIRERVFGKDHPDTASAAVSLGVFYTHTGEPAKAEPHFRRAVAIREAKLPKDHPDTLFAATKLAIAYERLGEYAKAEPLYLRVLAAREAPVEKDYAAIGMVMTLLGMMYIDAGEPAKAEPLLYRSLALREQHFGADHIETMFGLDAVANHHAKLNQYAKAEPLYRRILAAIERTQGNDHPLTASAALDLGHVLRAQKKYAEAEPLLLRAVAIREARIGKDHPGTALALENLAGLYAVMEQSAKAEPLHRRVLAIREARLGKDHPDVARVLVNLGNGHVEQGQSAKAEPLFRQALAIYETRRGPNHPDTAWALDNLAGMYGRLADWDKAAASHDRVRRIVRAYAAGVLPILSEAEQGEFLKETDEQRYHATLTQAVLRRDHPAERALSAGWVLNGKGVAGQVRAEQVLLARESRDPAMSRIAAELAEVRRSLAARSVQPPSGDAAAELAELTAKEQALSRQLTQLTGRAAKTTWAEVADVRKAIPDGGVLVEVARYGRQNLTRKPGEKEAFEDRYAAWVIPPTGDVQLIDLGDAAPIDAAVADVRTELEAAPKTITAQGEPAAEAQLRKPLEVVAKLVLHPLLPHIQEAKTWVISPDGPLWVVPWAALPLPDGKYAAEGHDVRYVVTGRDLLAGKNTKVTPAAPLILADPDFDLAPAAAAAATKKLAPDAPAESRGLSRGLALGNVRRLPGTATEAEAIAPKLKQYTGADVALRTDADALTGVFKAARNPRVVVLSTHGFFLAAKKDGPAAENVLLRCGLLLAGCNRAADAKPGGDTGVLTGLEIVGTDLRGTELVVLSACETGLGDVRTGDGVAGLRQAFQLAGAESVIATLWQVPDRESALLMSAFFDQLSAKAPRDAALATAQRDMVKQRRDRFGAAHPYFWAAYTLTGQAN